MNYWLMKSEFDTFGIDHFAKKPKQIAGWDGVRNFQARNYLREMQVGDLVFFYHSSTEIPGVVGIAKVVREAYPDSTAFDKSHHGYDEDSDPDDPTWFMVDLRAVAPLPQPVTLTGIKAKPELAQMALLRIGRLSVTPVTAREWEVIRGMAG